MTTILYNVLIAPLVLILEFFYELIYEITDNQGLAVIGLSFVVTLITLPLYMIAERYQEIERKTQERFKPYIKRIKETFKGDEQYMILNTYYRENHYHPMMALRSSISLLIQVPFFLAAYNFLSTLQTVHEYSFLFIKDFGLPDAAFTIGNFTVNILPILMTLINIVAGAIYSKNHPIGEKIQIYGLASIFLVVLYNSPSRLVVYWTMNNILSLVKNVFYKIKNPKKVLYIILCLFSFACLVSPFTILASSKNIIKLGLILLAVILPILPFALIKISSLFENNFKSLDENPTLLNSVFFISASVIALLAGFVIPSILVDSEPNNYCYVYPHSSPFVFIWITFWKAVGLFVVWPGAFYLMFTNKVKKIFTFIFSVLCLCAIINTFAFGGKYGPIESTLLFMEPQDFKPSLSQAFINITIIFVLCIGALIILLKAPKIMQSVFTILLVALLAISTKNGFSINYAYSRMEEPSSKKSLEPIFSLSKTQKNVMLIMLDKCYSPFIPYILDDLPELREKLDGFVFYPNTVSLGTRTMVGVPGIYGGYEYTPYQINKRKNETLQKKHNEALLTLPVIFSEEGYKTQVTGLPYENFLEYPISKMYENYPKLERLETYGPYADYWYENNGVKKSPVISNRIKRNFIAFSIFKMVSPVFRSFIYHNEYWTSFDEYDKTEKFIEQYSVLDYLPELTSINTENQKGSFIILDNECTHESIYLQAPDYVPVENITDYGSSIFSKDSAYSTTCGVLLRLAEFFDYLKQNDAYNNTRIIIVSDHGKDDTSIASKNINIYDDMPYLCSDFVATLLVKDFDSLGTIKQDNTFMTNADSPALCVQDLIEDAKNPFTGNPIAVQNKNDFVILHAGPAQSTKTRYESKYRASKDQWFTVKDNIFDSVNWGKYTE